MKKLLLTSLTALLSFTLLAQQSLRIKAKNTKRSESTFSQKARLSHPSLLQLTGTITCNTNYTAGTTMALNFNLLLSNTDLEYGDSLSLTFPAGITPMSSPNNPLGPDDGQAGSDGPEAYNGVFGQTISWGNNDNNYGGIVPGVAYPFTVMVTISSGVSGIKFIPYHVSGDGFGGNPLDLNGTITIFDVPPPFSGCLPTNVYPVSSWQEPGNLGVPYAGYVCTGHDSLLTRGGWNFYDGDGYFVNLIAGGQYRFTLDSCTNPVALTLSDSNGVSGTIIGTNYSNAACPNSLTITAPYTGSYYINTSLNGICGATGLVAIASGGIKLLNSVSCPATPAAPVNDTICGAIAMVLGTTYSGNTTTALATDTRDADATNAGFGCSTPNNTLWYSYTAAATDTFFVTINSPSINGLDGWLGFFSANSCTAAFDTGACLSGPTPGNSYVDTVFLTSGVSYYFMVDGFAGALGAFDITIVQSNYVPPVFAGCLPVGIYSASAWQEPSALGVAYSGYVCNGHDSLQTRSGWQYYDGDGYFLNLVAGGQYRITLDSCSAPIALTVSDSNGVAGAIINGVYMDAACPNQLTFTAPYTGTYYVTASVNGICGNSGATPIASAGVKLLNSVTCPAIQPAPINDTICGAIALTIGTNYNGNNTTASLTDPRDGDVVTAGFGCSLPQNTLWFTYTAAVTDTFYLTVNSPAAGGLDAWVGLFEATNCTAAFSSGACLLGPIPGSSYTDTLLLTAGSTYYIMLDGYAGAVGAFSLTLTQSPANPVFNGCLPTTTYSVSPWQEPTAIGTPYVGYICNGHDSLQNRATWQFYDGDGYLVNLVAGGQYRFSIDSCSAPIGLTVSDSGGVAGTIFNGAFAAPACPNQITFTAPYTGSFYINASLNGICGNAGTAPMASVAVKLLNSVNCPAVNPAPVNDTICGAIALTLGTVYNGNNTTANSSDPRDNDVVAAGFACSTPSNTLWYSYTALATDTFFITVNSPAVTGLDSWVGLFEASSCTSSFTSGACLLGPIPGSAYTDTVLFTAGTSYYIMIDGYAGATGAFSLSLTQNNSTGPIYPINDTICGAIPLSLGVTVSGTNASANPVDPNDNNVVAAGFNCGAPNNTLWYSYTAAVSDTFYITTNTPNLTGLTAIVGLFEASACSGALTNGQCFFAALPGGGNHIDTVLFTAGTTYYLMIDGEAGATGAFNLTLTKATHSVGLEALALNQNVSIYPNPSDGRITLTTTELSTDIMIYNTLGEVVYAVQKLNKGTHNLILTDLPKGMYSIKSNSSNKTEIKYISLIH